MHLVTEAGGVEPQTLKFRNCVNQILDAAFTKDYLTRLTVGKNPNNLPK